MELAEYEKMCHFKKYWLYNLSGHSSSTSNLPACPPRYAFFEEGYSMPRFAKLIAYSEPSDPPPKISTFIPRLPRRHASASILAAL